jgi:hypothetical protein
VVRGNKAGTALTDHDAVQQRQRGTCAAEVFPRLGLLHAQLSAAIRGIESSPKESAQLASHPTEGAVSTYASAPGSAIKCQLSQLCPIIIDDTQLTVSCYDIKV